MGETYTRKGLHKAHTHGGDIHTEGTYTQKGHAHGHTQGTYTRRRHTHERDIHTDIHKGHTRGGNIHTEETYIRSFVKIKL